jgi:hypothetical protein
VNEAQVTRWVRALEREFPQSALTQALAATDSELVCGRTNPAGDAVCTRPRGHGITNMKLPDGHRAYVDHCTSPDGAGQGW